ncbi:MAG: YraN family protein [Legionella sp.]|nr:YraN family protein [Legionella sp.]
MDNAIKQVKLTTKTIGQAAEDAAKNYLLAEGLSWITSNYRCYCGEIDLIMEDSCQKDLIFVEVRARRNAKAFGGAVESITRQKRGKLLKTASHFLLSRRQYAQRPMRFDVICFDGHPYQINWIKNAFGFDS